MGVPPDWRWPHEGGDICGHPWRTSWLPLVRPGHKKQTNNIPSRGTEYANKLEISQISSLSIFPHKCKDGDAPPRIGQSTNPSETCSPRHLPKPLPSCNDDLVHQELRRANRSDWACSFIRNRPPLLSSCLCVRLFQSSRSGCSKEASLPLAPSPPASARAQEWQVWLGQQQTLIRQRASHFRAGHKINRQRRDSSPGSILSHCATWGEWPHFSELPISYRREGTILATL